MTKQELHNLVDEYWVFTGKRFSRFYLHQEIGAEESLTTNSVYNEFIKYINKNKYDR